MKNIIKVLTIWVLTFGMVGTAKAGILDIRDLAKEPFIQTHPGEDTETDTLIHKFHLKLDVRFTTLNAYTLIIEYAVTIIVYCAERFTYFGLL